MTDTSDIKAGSGLPAEEIERRIEHRKSFIEAIERVARENPENWTSASINAAIDEEKRQIDELKESLNERTK